MGPARLERVPAQSDQSTLNICTSRSAATPRFGKKATLVGVALGQRFRKRVCVRRFCERRFVGMSSGACVRWPLNVQCKVERLVSSAAANLRFSRYLAPLQIMIRNRSRKGNLDWTRLLIEMSSVAPGLRSQHRKSTAFSSYWPSQEPNHKLQRILAPGIAQDSCYSSAGQE